MTISRESTVCMMCGSIDKMSAETAVKMIEELRAKLDKCISALGWYEDICRKEWERGIWAKKTLKEIGRWDEKNNRPM